MLTPGCKAAGMETHRQTLVKAGAADLCLSPCRLALEVADVKKYAHAPKRPVVQQEQLVFICSGNVLTLAVPAILPAQSPAFLTAHIAAERHAKPAASAVTPLCCS
jgi:formate-dependent phosphoribosylglycinamide formyltransferase (GAR transformylase)